MIDRFKIWAGSKPWYWKLRTRFGKLSFFIERFAYKRSVNISKTTANTRILGAFAWIGAKSLFWVVLALGALIATEDFVRNSRTWLRPLSSDDRDFNIEQLRLYAQILTAIFSIYFATIGIILSAGYTKLRRDIIYMLTNEQVGSVYARVLVLAAMFCLAATTLPMVGFQPGLFVYIAGTILTLLSAMALFPLGQRLFNFFDLNLLVHSEILPDIARHIEGAANPKKSRSLANHHSMSARTSLEQLSYIDDRVKADRQSLQDNLPALTSDYTSLLLHYLGQKHRIDGDSYWFPRKSHHKQWFFADDSATSMALQTSSQQMLVEEKTNHEWLENEIVEKLADHVEAAFIVRDYDLALRLLGRFAVRASAYADQFQFHLGMRELKKFKSLIEAALSAPVEGDEKLADMTSIGLADTWAALGSNLCLETLRRMITFEKELKSFFDADDWSEDALHKLPAFLQVDLAFIVERIDFEIAVEGRRLSQPKYVQQLAVQKLLQHYEKILPQICEFHHEMIPDFVAALKKLKMTEAATQVVLGSLHSHWKLPRWFDQIAALAERYQAFEHHKEEQYSLPKSDPSELVKKIEAAHEEALAALADGATVAHIFEPPGSEELPDHFGQIYFELAEACINALQQNDEAKLNKVLLMFMTLAFLAADHRFVDPSLEINDEFRLHLISTVINDLTSVLGFAILYGAYFENDALANGALAKFDEWIARAEDKQLYLRRMVLISNPRTFSMSASPRGLIRTSWKILFEGMARQDGFGSRMGMSCGKPHPNNTVRSFLDTHADASHLFFAQHIMPDLDDSDFEVEHQIASLVRRLEQEDEEVLDEVH
ncbi:MAG: hypothetical protein R8G34_11215 [Paracoccaceae bacterium]|nr:hypothetical protein [Paracoccaceae bacterium]